MLLSSMVQFHSANIRGTLTATPSSNIYILLWIWVKHENFKVVVDLFRIFVISFFSSTGLLTLSNVFLIIIVICLFLNDDAD